MGGGTNLTGVQENSWGRTTNTTNYAYMPATLCGGSSAMWVVAARRCMVAGSRPPTSVNVRGGVGRQVRAVAGAQMRRRAR